jgi:tRNA (cytidine/uridine-2'-O-)-methyltransferase
MNQRQNMKRNESENRPTGSDANSTTGSDANSLSRPLAPCNDTLGNDTTPADRAASAHVVLYQPEIPQNTGNIGRTCVAVGAKLWIVRPAGFQINDSRVRRAGLDYWKHLELGDATNWDDLLEQLNPPRMFFLSKFARRTLWEAEFQIGDTFVFGRETSGLPDSIFDPHDPRSLRLPISDQVRSLNLATTVGIVLYEQQRQLAQQISGASSESSASDKLS